MKNCFDYTAMSTFLTCRRKYELRINKGYVRQWEPSAPNFGSAIHHALDNWYVNKDAGKAIEVFNANYTEDLKIDDRRTKRMGEWIINNYHSQYKDQPWELVESETCFEVALPNNNKFIGRIDKVIKWDGCFWIVDHKTTTSLGSTFFHMAEPNFQFPGYVWAKKQLGVEVSGVIVDAILAAKGLLPGTSKNTNLTPLARCDIYYKEEALQEWLESALKIQRDIGECEVSQEWYPNFDACTDYGGCTYRQVCKEESGIRQRILDADYLIEPWNPRREKK